ncbi:hypothetical protein KQ51_01190 [Candidatus Izimaplasma bacterium HR1]|jgi:hypothetical protein|uniref:immunoglobulin-like domain-containing protein n=1 Tax=Candidatus Izimoplasma sp. HR1 TaxID=1541959 RepID=UPI0004F63D95|nr:hypothetical protein KQ51_01190 [Candidatus Izimaplasma bacterium HR1]
MKKLIVISTLLLVIVLSACNGGTPETIDFILNDGNDTVEINTLWEDMGASLTDGENTFIIYSDDTLNSSILGLNEITYELIYLEETFELTRYVIVTDQTPPELTLLPGLDTLTKGTEWEDTGITVTDNSNETLTYQVEGTVLHNIAGVYEITYTATDSSGNTNTINRFVTIIN